jgi:hypothetical protein
MMMLMMMIIIIIIIIIHRKLAEAAEFIEDKSPHYMYTQANVHNFKLYWNRSIIADKTVQTVQTVPANRPDINFTNRKTKTTYLIDIAVRNTYSCPENTKFSTIHTAVPNTQSCPQHTKLSPIHIAVPNTHSCPEHT